MTLRAACKSQKPREPLVKECKDVCQPDIHSELLKYLEQRQGSLATRSLHVLQIMWFILESKKTGKWSSFQVLCVARFQMDEAKHHAETSPPSQWAWPLGLITPPPPWLLIPMVLITQPQTQWAWPLPATVTLLSPWWAQRMLWLLAFPLC